MLFTIHLGLQEDAPNRDAEANDYLARRSPGSISVPGQAVLRFHFRDHDDVFRPEIGIVQAHRNHAAIMNGGWPADNLLDVLRVDDFRRQ